MMILANQLWHTDSSFKRVPGRSHCCLHEKCPRQEGRRNLPICAPPTMPLSP
jgi:hypothetical protein